MDELTFLSLIALNTGTVVRQGYYIPCIHLGENITARFVGIFGEFDNIIIKVTDSEGWTINMSITDLPEFRIENLN